MHEFTSDQLVRSFKPHVQVGFECRFENGWRTFRMLPDRPLRLHDAVLVLEQFAQEEGCLSVTLVCRLPDGRTFTGRDVLFALEVQVA